MSTRVSAYRLKFSACGTPRPATRIGSFNRGRSAVDEDIAANVEDLVLEREWSPEQYQEYVTNVLIGALTASRSEPVPPTGQGLKGRDSRRAL
jgi:hypothetical protein